MTHVLINHQTDQRDRLFVDIDRRFPVWLVRTKQRLEILVYPPRSDHNHKQKGIDHMTDTNHNATLIVNPVADQPRFSEERGIAAPSTGGQP